MVDRINIKQAVNTIEFVIKEPSNGLPEDVFLFVSRITPMVNVDLLIKNEENQMLLTWRHDGYYKARWHVPGGIIGYKETISERIRVVAKTDLGAVVEFQANPLAINEIIHPGRKVQGHFISLPYQCSLITPADEVLRYRSGAPQSAQSMCHATSAEKIIEVHKIYRKYICWNR